MMRAMRICNFLYFLSAAALLTLAACGTTSTSTSKPETPPKPALIPMPVNVEPTRGYFELREGVNFLQKPYSPHKLAQAVREVLER